ncbi:MAG: hypothetical protein CL569_09510 [Alphaproteobacteria bacterium]|nr:hypothetical protein [Alphaproteobacteria bacterium]
MMVDAYFPATYSEARSNFLSACTAAELAVESYENPEKGPDGEALYCDVALLGDPNAPGVVVTTSATHGVEGYAGSGIQVGMLRDPVASRPSPNVALLFIHTINPHGMAWLRRENEDNVDLNRNFVDHAGGNYPENDLFEELVDYLVPSVWDDNAYQTYKSAITELNQKYGEVPVRKAMHKGQYRHPDSIHYGGDKAAWSNETLSRICVEFLDQAERAVMIDLHTGLGPYGYGELMTPSKPGEAVFDLLHDWYGDEVHSTTAGATLYAGSKGSILAGFRPPVDGLEWAAVGLEYGTREREHIRRCMLANTWLHLHGDLDSELGRQIRRDFWDCYYPDESEWKQLVWERGNEVIGIALERMAAELKT